MAALNPSPGHTSPEPIPVHFPLMGEFLTVKTPAHRIPSHGVNWLGQRFAFDFIGTDPQGRIYTQWTKLRHYLAIAPVTAFWGWDRPVLSPVDGTVVGLGEGV